MTEALPRLEAAGKTEPDHGQLLFDRARCLAQLDQHAAARPLLKRSSTRNRDGPTTPRGIC